MKKLAVAVLLCAALLPVGCSSPHYRLIKQQWVFYTPDTGMPADVQSIPGADAATFRPLADPLYARDHNHIYYEGQVIPGADPTSFEQVGSSYWKDKNRVYFQGAPIPGSRPGSIKQLRYYEWAIDERNAYFHGNPINPRDLSTFQLVNEFWAKDSKQYYFAGAGCRPLKNIDYASFTILRDGWARDRYHIYFEGDVVPGVDLATFKIDGPYIGHDKNELFVNGKRRASQ